MSNAREPLDPRESLWHFLAYLLRYEREKQGLSLTQWGRIIGAARSTVSNIEAGRRKIAEDQARTIDRKFDTGGLFEVLLWFARILHNPDWLRQYTEYEQEAEVIRIYQGQALPIPLQTEGYIRALVEASNIKDEEGEVQSRLARTEAVLNREDPPYVCALLEETALYNEIGGPEVMREQLLHLIELGKSSQVSIRLIPKNAGAHPGVDGPFRIMSLESRDVAYVGAQRGGRLIEATGEVRELGVDYERIGAKAASEDVSRAMIVQLLETCT